MIVFFSRDTSDDAAISEQFAQAYEQYIEDKVVYDVKLTAEIASISKYGEVKIEFNSEVENIYKAFGKLEDLPTIF